MCVTDRNTIDSPIAVQTNEQIATTIKKNHKFNRRDSLTHKYIRRYNAVDLNYFSLISLHHTVHCFTKAKSKLLQTS